jgi:hypothetical protein
MTITKFQETCKDVLDKVVDNESLSQDDKLSAGLQAALSAFGGEGREASLRDIETIIHFAAAAIGAFNLQHLAKGSFKRGEDIDYSADAFGFAIKTSPIVAEALLNIAYASVLDQEHVPTSPQFFRDALTAATRLLGAKAASRLGVESLSVEEKSATVNQFVSGVYQQAASSAVSTLLTQYNTSASLLGQSRLDEETHESISSEFADSLQTAGIAVAKKWQAHLQTKLDSMAAAAKPTKGERQ